MRNLIIIHKTHKIIDELRKAENLTNEVKPQILSLQGK